MTCSHFQISLIESIGRLSMTTQLESDHERQQPMRYTETAQPQDKSGMYSTVSVLLQKRGVALSMT